MLFLLYLTCQYIDSLNLIAAGMRDDGTASAASTVCHAQRRESVLFSARMCSKAVALRDGPG